MGTNGKRDERSYQEYLRKLGAWLDAIYAHRINIIELANGFSTRYQLHEVDTVFMQRFFTYHEVESLRWGDLRLRRNSIRHAGLARDPGGYQDLFRALGYRLDSQSASRVQLDERDNQLDVEYQRPDPIPETGSQQFQDTLGPEDREIMRQEAHARRREASRWRMLARR